MHSKPIARALLCATLPLVPAVASAADYTQLDPQLRKFFGTYCVDCHGDKKEKGDFRIDMLKLSENDVDAEHWRLVLDNLHLGDMPPEDEKQPTIAELEPITSWIEAELKRASRDLAGHGSEVVLRRLNRTEYENTIEDLLGVRGDYALGFPEDTRAEGFDNIGAALMLSAAQMNQYLEAADFILDRAIVSGGPPKTNTLSMSLKQLQDAERERSARIERNLRKKQKEEKKTPLEKKREELARQQGRTGRPYYPELDGVALIPNTHLKPTTARFFQVRQPGFYRFSIEVFPVRNEGKPIRLKLTYGSGNRNQVPETLDVVQLTEPDKQRFDYRVFLEQGQRFTLQMLDGPGYMKGAQIAEATHPMIAVPLIEVEGPLIEQWPPKGHRVLLGEIKPDELEDGQVPERLAAFAPKLFRRPVGPAVVDEFVAFYEQHRGDGSSPIEAFKLTAKAMMTSPLFLYHFEFPGEGEQVAGSLPVDAHALANRLSYFLWRSLPDDELFALADSGDLISDPAHLNQQVERMIEDPRFERFLRDFTGQWLEIEKVGEIQPDANLYPEYDAELQSAMVDETLAYIREMIVADRPIRELIDSDWTMLNNRLARHYGIEGVDGVDFRKVELDKSDTIRGGLLTHASILNVTSNGTTTSPVVRGVWVLDKLLGTPAPEPPPDVPAIEPDIRGATTIKEQLEQHRSIEQCASCHQKIDPYGMALENFDVIGGWRESYRALEQTRNPRRPKLVDGNPIEVADRIPRVGEFDDFRAFRELLLTRDELVQTNLARTLAIFALGRTLTYSDDDHVKDIVQVTNRHDGGMKTMIHAMVRNPIFFRP